MLRQTVDPLTIAVQTALVARLDVVIWIAHVATDPAAPVAPVFAVLRGPQILFI